MIDYYLTHIATAILGAGVGYCICAYFGEEKLLKAYEDGVIDGKGLRDIHNIEHPRESWQ